MGCEVDSEKAKDNFLVAAERGHVSAMVYFGELLNKADPQRFVWFGRAAVSGYPFSFLNEMSYQVRNFDLGNGLAKFLFGRVLKDTLTTRSKQSLEQLITLTLTSGPQIRLFVFTNFRCKRIEKQSTAGQLLD
jgi:hypothetical protein